MSFTIELERNIERPPSPSPSKSKTNVSHQEIENTNEEQDTLVPTEEIKEEDVVDDYEDKNNQIQHINPDNLNTFYKFIYYLGYYSSRIKKIILVIIAAAIIYFIGKYINNHYNVAITDKYLTEVAVDSIAEEVVVNESDSIVSFLTLMYSNYSYNDYRFLQKHCTQQLLAILSEAYDYDCPETPCYATWLFRSSAQDEKSPTENESRVLFIKNLGENWFEVEFYDMGWKCVKRIKAYFNSQGIIMDNVENVFDEPAEYLKNMQEPQDSLNATTN